MNILVARDLQMALFVIPSAHYDIILYSAAERETVIIHKNPARWAGPRIQKKLGGRKFGQWRYPGLHGFTTSQRLETVIKKLKQGYPDADVEDYR